MIVQPKMKILSSFPHPCVAPDDVMTRGRVNDGKVIFCLNCAFKFNSNQKLFTSLKTLTLDPVS